MYTLILLQEQSDLGQHCLHRPLSGTMVLEISGHLPYIDPFLDILQLSTFDILSSILECRIIIHCVEKIIERSNNLVKRNT